MEPDRPTQHSEPPRPRGLDRFVAAVVVMDRPQRLSDAERLERAQQLRDAYYRREALRRRRAKWAS